MASQINLNNPEALDYESRLSGDPYSPNLWLSYVASFSSTIDTMLESLKKSKNRDKQSLIHATISSLSKSIPVTYERAVALIPGSYKVWYSYLRHLTSVPSPSTHCHVTSVFERSLIRMNKYPRIWHLYLKHIALNRTQITSTRRLFDHCLQSLPISQHSDIWEMYRDWALQSATVESTIRVLRRHSTFDPSALEDFAEYLEKHGRFKDASEILVQCLSTEGFVSKKGRSYFDVWMEVARVWGEHGDVVGGGFERVVRAKLITGRQKDGDSGKRGDAAFQEVQGVLWCKLADYYTRMGSFDRARSIYEEGMVEVTRVRDFSLIFDAYSRFEEETLTAKVEMQQGEESSSEDDSDAEDGSDDNDSCNGSVAELIGEGGKEGNEIELALARAEYLMERRPLLLNAVLLRQNPHNIGEWHNRVELLLSMEEPTGGVVAAIGALGEATKKVDSQRAVNGSPASLWIKLAEIYEEHGEDGGKDAREVYRNVCSGGVFKFKSVDDLAQCYCHWAEMELRLENFDEALKVVREGVAPPGNYEFSGQQSAGGNKFKGGKAQTGLHRSLRLWNLRLDLEESLGSVEQTKSAYGHCLTLGVATPQIVLNFAEFLSENKFFEEAFQAYEKGLGLFSFPQKHAKPIWEAYLAAFEKRYEGKKMERVRELYERCLEKCPEEFRSAFFIPYAKIEEKYGLAKRALQVYERACTSVPQEEKLAAYQLYIAKAEGFFGATKTRVIYEAAIAALLDADAAKMCLRYCELETKLGEIDRARASLAYGAQLVDPRREPVYWRKWHEFEVSHGNEETFKEMLRVKRSVSAAFSTVNYNAAEMSGEQGAYTEGQAMAKISREENLEEGDEVMGGSMGGSGGMEGFVSSGKPGAGGKKRKGGPDSGGIEELERQAIRIKSTLDEGGIGNDGDEIDIDE